MSMRMQKRQFRIGDLAKQLDVEKFVIRFWEKEFKLKPSRSEGGQRFYKEKDLQTFAAIKNLLYDQGFTIAGARKQLSKNIIPSQKISEPQSKPEPKQIDNTLFERVNHLHKQLLQLRDLL